MARRRSGLDLIDDVVDNAVESLFDRASDAFAQMRARNKQTLPTEYLAQKLTCASCRNPFPGSDMEMVHPTNGYGVCRRCFKFMWTAGVEKLKTLGKQVASGGGRPNEPRARADAPEAKPVGKPPWEVLGVAQDASIDEIKKSYRRLAMLWHPDRVSSEASADDKLKSKAMFDDIQRAYSVMMKVRSAPEVG